MANRVAEQAPDLAKLRHDYELKTLDESQVEEFLEALNEDSVV